MGLLKLVAAGSIGITMMGAGWIMTKQGEKETIAKFGLDGQRAEFFLACKGAMSAEKKKFTRKSLDEGCGCLAKESGTGLERRDYTYLLEVHRAVLVNHSKQDRDTFGRNVDAAATKSGVPSHRVGELLSRFKKAQDVCL